MTTLAPSPAIFFATAAPIPLEAPVTNITLLFNVFIILCFICCYLFELTTQRWLTNRPLNVQGLQQELQISKNGNKNVPVGDRDAANSQKLFITHLLFPEKPGIPHAQFR